jgi:hypothetical protein
VAGKLEHSEMNKRIKELAEQAGYVPLEPRAFADDLHEIFLQKFGKLIADDIASMCEQYAMPDGTSETAIILSNMIKKRYGV